MATRETRLAEVRGIYRRTLMHAIALLHKEIEKAKKSMLAIGADTDEADEIESAAEHLKWCLGESRSDGGLAGTPMGEAIAEGERRADPLAPPGPDSLRNDVLMGMLAAINVEGRLDDIETWNDEQRRDVYRWSRAQQLLDSGEQLDLIPGRPHCVPLAWFQQDLRAAIERGEVDGDTLQPVELTDEEQEQYLHYGPWRVVELTTDDEEAEEWAVEWGEALEAVQDENAVQMPTLPEHPFVYDTRAEAEAVAARLNKLIAVQTAPLIDDEVAAEAAAEAEIVADLEPAVSPDDGMREIGPDDAREPVRAEGQEEED